MGAFCAVKKFLKKKKKKSSIFPTCRSDFDIISQKCFLIELSQKLSAKFRSVIKHCSSEWELLSLYGHWLWSFKKFRFVFKPFSLIPWTFLSIRNNVEKKKIFFFQFSIFLICLKFRNIYANVLLACLMV